MPEKFDIWTAFQSGQANSAIAGLFGSVVYIAMNKNLSARDSVAAVFTGCILAAYIAPVVGERIDADDGLISLLGLMIGIAGMNIGPILAKGTVRGANALVRRLGGTTSAAKDSGDDTSN